MADGTADDDDGAAEAPETEQRASSANSGGTAGAPVIGLQDPVTGRFVAGNPNTFKPGQSGNPGGRPPEPPEVKAAKAKKLSLSAALTDELQEPIPIELQPMAAKLGVNPNSSMFALWLRALIVNGLRGRPTAQREVNERVDGKVPLPIKLPSSVGTDSQTDLVVTIIQGPALTPGGVDEAAARQAAALPE